MTAVTVTSLNQCQTKIKEDWSSDPKCCGGVLANFEGSTKCKFIRRIAKIKDKLVNYRVVELNNGKYWFQTGVLKVKQEEADEEDEDVEKSNEEEVEKPPAKAGASAKGAKKRKAAAAVAEEGAAAVAEALSTVVPSVGGQQLSLSRVRQCAGAWKAGRQREACRGSDPYLG